MSAHQLRRLVTAEYLPFLQQAGWVCQALAALGVPYAPNMLYTPNGMGKVFFWIFVLFPWNPLTKGVLDMSAAANSSLHPGKHAWDIMLIANGLLMC